MDITKLSKLMQLTTSTYDGECLTAIRKANLLLAENDLTWETFIKEKNITIKEIVIKKEKDPEIENMLKLCRKTVRSSSIKMFVNSLSHWYKEHGSLTEKQKEALTKIYSNI